MQGLRVDLIEQGRLLCSMKVPPRLLVGTLNFNSLQNSISLFALKFELLNQQVRLLTF